MVILLPGHDEAETDIQKTDTTVMYGVPKSRLEEHIRNLKAKTFRAVQFRAWGRAEKESHFESSELKSSCFIGNRWVGQKNKCE